MAETPIAKCAIKSVNGKPYQKDQKIEPLDDIRLTAKGSRATATGASITAYNWEISKRPLSSSVTLTGPNKAETGFRFSNDVKGLDLAGEFKIYLAVTDSLGAQSYNECAISLKAVPSAKLHIQLVWDTNYGDMDLHLAKKDTKNQLCASFVNEEAIVGPLASSQCLSSEFLECNYGTGRSYHDTFPNWDSTASKSVGDPTLDIDDLSGLGPENINIKQPSRGELLVSVHHFAGGRPSGSTVRIYLYGKLYAEFYKILKPNDWWEAAIIEWPESENSYPCITDLQKANKTCMKASLFTGNVNNQKSFIGCTENSDCGFNTICDLDSHNCISQLNLCKKDDDCPIEKRCVTKTKNCVIPECENDRQCKVDNMNSRCNLSNFQCYLPR